MAAHNQKYVVIDDDTVRIFRIDFGRRSKSFSTIEMLEDYLLTKEALDWTKMYGGYVITEVTTKILKRYTANLFKDPTK